MLNEQRNKIYQQRDRIFTKDDLAEDLDEMLTAEIDRRVDLAFADDDGPWRLLDWTDQVQPPLAEGDTVYPSYTLEVLLRDLGEPASLAAAKAAILRLAREALEAERAYILRLADTLLERSEERAATATKERREQLEMALEGVELEAQESGQSVEPRALVKAASDVIGLDSRSAASLLPAGNAGDLDPRKFK